MPYRTIFIVLICHAAFLFALEHLALPLPKKAPLQKVTVHTFAFQEKKSPPKKKTKQLSTPQPALEPIVESPAPEPIPEVVVAPEPISEPIAAPEPVPEPVKEEKSVQEEVVAKPEPKPTPKPVVKAEKKTTTPAKKPPSKPSAKAPTKSTKPSSPKKTAPKATVKASPKPVNKNQEKLVSLMKESLSQLDNTTKKKKGGGSSGNTSSPSLGKLSSESLSFDSPLTTYQEELSLYLKHLLKLPEHGDVKVKLTLTSAGKMTKLIILSAASDKNRAYVEKMIPTLSLPGFADRLPGEKEHTFPITLKSN